MLLISMKLTEGKITPYPVLKDQIIEEVNAKTRYICIFVMELFKFLENVFHRMLMLTAIILGDITFQRRRFENNGIN